MAVVDLVFRRDIGPPAAADRLTHALTALGGFRQEQEQQIGEEMFTMRWQRDAEQPVAVDLTFDRSVPMLMASVISNDERQAAQTADALRDALSAEIDGPDDLLDAAAKEPGDAALLVRAAVAHAQRFDGRMFGLVDDALRSGDMKLRQAGAKAAALVKYAQLAPTLRAAVDREKDETTGRMLALAMAKVRNAMQG